MVETSSNEQIDEKGRENKKEENKKENHERGRGVINEKKERKRGLKKASPIQWQEERKAFNNKEFEMY